MCPPCVGGSSLPERRSSRGTDSSVHIQIPAILNRCRGHAGIASTRAECPPLSSSPPLPETLPQSTYCLGFCKPTCGNQRNPNFATSTNLKFLFYSIGPAPYYGISRHLDGSKLFQLQVMCKTPSQRLEALGVVSDLIRLGRFHGCVRSNQQCPHSSAESEIISLDADGRTDGMPALYFRACDVETLMCTRATGYCEQIRHRQIYSQQSSPKNNFYVFEDNVGVIHIDHPRTKLRHEARHKNSQSEFGLAVRGN